MLHKQMLTFFSEISYIKLKWRLSEASLRRLFIKQFVISYYSLILSILHRLTVRTCSAQVTRCEFMPYLRHYRGY